MVEALVTASKTLVSDRSTVGGTVSGLAGGELSLKLNNGVAFSIKANGSFAFPDRLSVGTGFTITIAAQPAGQICTPSLASGTVVQADVTDLSYTCSQAGTAVTPAYVWHTFYGGQPEEGNPETQTSVVDNDGNLIVAGIAFGAWPGDIGAAPINAYTAVRNLWVLKLDSQGNYLWHTFLGSTNTVSGYNHLRLALDRANNIYIGGASSANWRGPLGQNPLSAFHGGNLDGFVLKLDQSGEYQWHRFIGGGTNLGHDAIYDIAVDASDAVYVTGESTLEWNQDGGGAPLNRSLQVPSHLAGAGSFAPFVAKLDGKGQYQWHTFYGRNRNSSAYAGGLAIDSDGNIYVSGLANVGWPGAKGTMPLHPISSDSEVVADLFLLKLKSDGSYLWHSFQDASLATLINSSAGRRMRVVADTDRSVLISGTADAARLGPDGSKPLEPFHGSHDIFVTKYSEDGEYQWHGYYGSADRDELADLKLTDTGALVITGYAESSWAAPTGAGPATPFNTASFFQEGVVFSLNAADGLFFWHTFLEGAAKAVAIGNDAFYVSGEGATHYVREPARFILGPSTPSPLRGIDGLFVLRYRP
nr:SBBP repeat-containing protein [Methylicorpusculum oleiharenae]